MKQNKGVNLINKVSFNDILPLKSTVFSMIHAKSAFWRFNITLKRVMQKRNRVFFTVHFTYWHCGITPEKMGYCKCSMGNCKCSIHKNVGAFIRFITVIEPVFHMWNTRSNIVILPNLEMVSPNWIFSIFEKECQNNRII